MKRPPSKATQPRAQTWKRTATCAPQTIAPTYNKWRQRRGTRSR